MEQTLVEAYSATPVAGRRAALESLLRTLPAIDCAFIHNLLVELRDPISRLPPEVVLRVFDFLHPFYGWSLRIICRRWNAFLTSTRAVRAQLARFEAHGSLYTALDPDVWRSERSRIRHVQALRLGRPFRLIVVKDELALSPSLTTKASAVQGCCLCQAHVAYLRGTAHQSNTVVLYNITDQSSRIFSSDARERLVGLTLSQDILAFANYGGFLYVADFQNTNDTYQVRLPSSNIVAMVVDGKLIAVLLRNDATTSTLVLHDQTWRQTSSFVFAHQPDESAAEKHIPAHTILLNASNSTVDVFGCALSLCQRSYTGHTIPSMRIGHTRFSLSGEMLCSSVAQCDEVHISGSETDTEYSMVLGAVVSIGRSGLFCIPCATRSMRETPDKKWSIIFDAVTTDFHHPSFRNEDAMCGFDEKHSHQLIWKGCGYSSSTYTHLSTVRLARSADDYDHSVGSIRLAYPREDDRIAFGSSPPALSLVMNDSFIIRFMPATQSILIMCFDEDVVLGGAKPTGLWAGSAEDSDSAIVMDTVQRSSRMRKRPAM